MDKDKKVGNPVVDPQVAAERFVELQNGSLPASHRFTDGRPHLLWHEIVGTERDKEPCGRFTYVAEKLIEDDSVRARVLNAMKEIRNRCVERDGQHGYLFLRRGELHNSAEGLAWYAADIRKLLPDFAGQINLETFHGLVPHPSWMTDEQWRWAFYAYVQVMTGSDDRLRQRRLPLSLFFDAIPNPFMTQFEMPARGVLTGHLVHEPFMGDLAGILAVAAGLAADGDAKALVVCDYLRFAARTPPLVVVRDDGFHLIHVCAD